MSKKMKVRSLLIGGIFTFLFIGLVVRLYWVQVVEASELLNKAEASWSENKKLPAIRGTIYDRNDKILAQDGSAYTVVVFPEVIHNKGLELEVVEALAPILNMTESSQKEKLFSLVTRKRENGKFLAQVEIRNEGWKIDSDLADQIRNVIEEKDLKGVLLYEEQKRYYPAQELASHVLGYTNKEGEAVLGLEAYYDKVLKGEPGQVRYDKDGKSFELPDSKVTYKPAVDGMAMKLTIDENIQLFIEQALEKSYEQFKPKNMTAIAVDPNTLEVLGMANYPNYNPNQYWSFNDYGDFYNHAVSSQYEPGSTFKIVTLAAAIEEGLFNPNATFKSGNIKIAGSRIHDHNYGAGWGENQIITYLEGLQRSSNVGFVKLGYEQLGADKLRSYINAFGFGLKTGIDLPGEAAGRINFRDNVPTEVATATFGQGRVSVTSIQQLAAISAIANGGKLMRPYIVKEIMDPVTHEVIESNEPEVIRQVISEQTSREVGGYLEKVISDQEKGTGRLAYIEGYQIAGKTGTAQKVIDGKYSPDKYIISFLGYAPLENPKIAVIVVADEPDIQGDYRLGSSVVAPVFKEIMAKSLRYFGVASVQNDNVAVTTEVKTAIPELHGLAVIGGVNELEKNGFEVEVIGEGENIVNQFPKAGTQAMRGQRIYILTEEPKNITLPDFTGMSLRDSFELCSLLQLECKVSGEGYVSGQEIVMKNETRELHLSLKPMSVSTDEEDLTEELVPEQ